jgi:2-dehydro-3-deoxygluconokinase
MSRSAGEHPIDIATLGECMVELSAAGADLEHAATLERSFGGDTFNVAAVAAAMGSSAAYLTALGTDPFGRYLLSAMDGLGVDTSGVISRPAAPTGVYFVEPDADGDGRFHYYRTGSAASTFGPDDLNRSLLERARVLHVSGITQALSASIREATKQACEVVRGSGGSVSYDPNYRASLWESPTHARDALDEVMPVDLLCPSLGDLDALFPDQPVDEVAKRFRNMGVGTVFVKAGPAGSYLATEDGARWIRGNPVSSPKDTTGAGDFAVGALLACLLRSWHPQEAAQVANRIAAETTKHHGSVGSVLAIEVGREFAATFAESRLDPEPEGHGS